MTEEDSGTEDSPIVYRAYEGEKVNLVGNMVISGSKFKPVEEQEILERLSDEVQDKVLVYDLEAENGLTQFSPIPKNGYGWPAQASAMSVLVDGKTQTLSRYPNSGFVNISSIQKKGFVPRDHMANPDGTCPQCTKEAGGGERIECAYGESKFLEQPGGVFTVNSLKDKYDLWSQENDIWTSGYFFWDWADDNCAIESVENTDTGLKMTMRHPSRYGVGQSGRKFYAYNLLCEVDQPGEWYLDRENAKLYLYPDKNIEKSDIELTMQGKPLVNMENVSYVDWQGVTFSKSNGHGLVMKDCENVEIAGCTFQDLGQRAIFMGDPEGLDDIPTTNIGNHGGSNNTVRSCDITRTGQGGVYVGGGNRYSLTPGNNKVVNCDISDFSTVKRTYSPAVELVGCGNSAERNSIYDAPHTAIQFKGNDMMIYGNDIHNVCYETADVGAIYSVRRWSWQGTVVKNNFIHDLVNTGGIGSAAVYIDDLGSGVTMTENLLVNIPGYTTLFGGGRDHVITNNIQINSGNGKGFHYDDRGLGWAWYHAAGPDGECYGELVNLRENPEYDKELWDERYPGLAAIDLDTIETRTEKGDGFKDWRKVAAQPANSLIEKNLLVGVANPFGNVSSNTRKYSKFDADTNIALAKGTDIGFANPDAYDFTVLKDSKIKEIMGDNHFKVEEMGLYEDEFRTLEKIELEKPVLTAPNNGEQDIIVTNGVRFTWQPVENAETYNLEVSEDKTFTDSVKLYSTDDTTISAAGLEKSKTYFWRVTARVKAVNGASSVSEVRMFTTSDKDDSSFFEGFQNFNNMEAAPGKGAPSRTAEKAHTGRYSYVLDESMDAIQKVFGSKHNDIVSVWLYDNMNKGNGAAGFVNVPSLVDGQEGNQWAGAGVSVEVRTGARKDNYSIRVGGTFEETDIERTEGWHELKWDYSDGQTCKISIDGQEVRTIEDVIGYDRIELGDFWDHHGYAGDVSGMMFDDLTVGTPELRENILSITFPEKSIQIDMDETYQLEPVVEADPDIDVELEYSTQEWEIAKVDENGLIQPVREGKTIVRAASKENPMIYTTATVIVGDGLERNAVQVESGHIIKIGEEECEETEVMVPVGAVVSIKADEAPEDMKFAGWEVIPADIKLADKNAAETTFTAPDSSVIIRATYANIGTPQNATRKSVATPSDWYAFADTDSLDELLDDEAIITEEDQEHLEKGWKVEVILNIDRKSSYRGTPSDAIREEMTEDEKTAFFAKTSLKKKITNRTGSKTETVNLSTANNAVRMTMEIPEKFEDKDTDKYRLIGWTEDMGASGYEMTWEREGRIFSFDGEANGVYALVYSEEEIPWTPIEPAEPVEPEKPDEPDEIPWYPIIPGEPTDPDEPTKPEKPSRPGNSGGSSSGGNTNSARRVTKNQNNTSSAQGNWKQNEKGWWFEYKDGGYPAYKWELVKDKWYYFNEAGYMATGWQFVNGNWYFLAPETGAMVTGWRLDTDGRWYYLDTETGAMKTGWKEIGSSWYYMNPSVKDTRPYGSMYQNEMTPDGYQVDGNGARINKK